MFHVRRAVFAVLIAALPGCFRSAPLKDDTSNPPDSAEPSSDEVGSNDVESVPTDNAVKPTDEVAPESTDNTTNSTEEESSDEETTKTTEATDSAANSTDEGGSDVEAHEATDSAVKPTDEGGSEGVSTEQTDSVELATESETAAVDTSVPRVPARHRPVSEACDPELDDDPSDGEEGGSCASDADCREQENGRCISNNHCVYDDCYTDKECEDGMVCDCGEGQYNSCYTRGNCRTDEDCGADGYCSPTLGNCGNFGILVGYYCLTPNDECMDDADCAYLSSYAYCAYNEVAGSWMCSESYCVG